MTTIELPSDWRTNRIAAARTLDTMRAVVRARARQPVSFTSPGDLALRLDPEGMRQTPALELIDRALVDVAEGRTSRLIISMPPQEGKSERATHYGVLWALQRRPATRAVIVSYADRIAQRFSYQIRSDIQTFGENATIDLGLRLRTDSKGITYWQLAEGGSLYAIGIGGSLTSQPVDLMVIDDPVKDYRAADSETQSEAAWLWWDSVARPRLAPSSPVVLILTRWSERDLAGRLIAKQKADEAAGLTDVDRWTVLTIPAQADFDPEKGETDPLGREPGEFMLSARGRTETDWRKTKAASSSRVWSALFQGRPSPASGNVWQKGWWRRYREPLWRVDGDIRRTIGMEEVYTSWDMTFKDSKGSDYVVGTVWGRRGAELYLLDRVRDRMTFTETLTAFEALARRWPDARYHLVEDKANGPAVLSSLRQKVTGLIPVEPKDSKYARASAVAVFIEGGNVILPADELVLWDVNELIDEAAVFPNGAHDDQVDSVSQAVARAFVDGSGASAWMAWLDRKIAADGAPEAESPETVPMPDNMGDEVEPEPEPELTDEQRRQAARNAQFSAGR